MSQLPSIAVYAAYMPLVKPHVAKYAAIELFTDNNFVHLRMSGEFSNVIQICLVDSADEEQWTEEYLRKLNRYFAGVNAMQKYVIFDKEYAWTRKKMDVYGCLRRLDVKTVFTPNIEEGFGYGLGLIDKGCKHGFYG